MKKNLKEIITSGTFDDKVTHTYRHFLQHSKAYFIGGLANAIEKEIKLLDSGDAGALNRAYRYYESKIDLKMQLFRKIGATDLENIFFEEYGQAGAGLRKIGALKVGKKRDINLPDKGMVADAYTTIGVHFGEQAKGVDAKQATIILKDSGLTAREIETVVNSWNNDEDPTEAYYSIAGRSDDTDERSERVTKCGTMERQPSYTEAERKEGAKVVEQIKKEIATETHWVIKEHSQGDYVSTSIDKGLPFFNFNGIEYADKFKTRNEAEDVIAILNTVYPKTSFSVESAEIPVESEEVQVDMINHPDKLYEITYEGKKMVVTLEYLRNNIKGRSEENRERAFRAQHRFKDIESFAKNEGFILRGNDYIPIGIEKLSESKIGERFEPNELAGLEHLNIKVIPFNPDIAYIDKDESWEAPKSFNERYEELKQRHPDVYSRESTPLAPPYPPSFNLDTFFLVTSKKNGKYAGKEMQNGLPVFKWTNHPKDADKFKTRDEAEEATNILESVYPGNSLGVTTAGIADLAKGGKSEGVEYLVKDIKWDIDGRAVNFPKQMTIVVPYDVIGYYETDQFISDAISDKSGFAHFGFETVPEIPDDEQLAKGGKAKVKFAAYDEAAYFKAIKIVSRESEGTEKIETHVTEHYGTGTADDDSEWSISWIVVDGEFEEYVHEEENQLHKLGDRANEFKLSEKESQAEYDRIMKFHTDYLKKYEKELEEFKKKLKKVKGKNKIEVVEEIDRRKYWISSTLKDIEKLKTREFAKGGVVKISEDDFYANYKPQINHIERKKQPKSVADEDVTSWGGKMYETYGEDLDYIVKMAKDPKTSKRVWTLVEGDDGNLYRIAGYHLVNRQGYMITEKEWKTGTEEVIEDYAKGGKIGGYDAGTIKAIRSWDDHEWHYVNPKDVLTLMEKNGIYAHDLRDDSEFMLDESRTEAEVQRLIDGVDFAFFSEDKIEGYSHPKIFSSDGNLKKKVKNS